MKIHGGKTDYLTDLENKRKKKKNSKYESEEDVFPPTPGAKTKKITKPSAPSGDFIPLLFSHDCVNNI